MHLWPSGSLGFQQSLPRIALLVLLILSMAVLAPILRSQQTTEPAKAGSADDDKSTEKSKSRTENAKAEEVDPAFKEDAIRARLEGKQIFLRVFDMDNDLKFDMNGHLQGNPNPGPFTLCAIDVKHVHFSKHKLEVEGSRMGLHFFGALPYEDDTRPFERIRLSKKPLKITIDRELVIIPKKKKEKEKDTPQQASAVAPKGNQPFGIEASPMDGAQASPAPPTATRAPEKAATDEPITLEPGTTTSPAHAARLLSEAVDKVFATKFDEAYIQKLPGYWQHYFEARGASQGQASVTPASYVRPGPEVSAPKIVSSLEPGSNEFAQKYNIAGVTLFHTVIDPQGHPEVLAVARPIGFGLDERAVDAIRRASFQPGIRDGKPVSVMVDLVVTFRIYSNRTRGSAIEAMSRPEQQKAEATPTPQ